MTIFNFCIGHNNSASTNIHQEGISLTKILILHWGISLKAGEIFCYSLFFIFVYKHDKHMGELNLLHDNIIRDRHRKNSFTMLAQVYSSGIKVFND